MNNIEHTIVFTLSTVKGFTIEAKWVIVIKNINSKDGRIKCNLKIMDAECQIIQHENEWYIKLLPGKDKIARDYIKIATSQITQDSDIFINITEAEKEYIEVIAEDFIQPFAKRIAERRDAAENGT